MYFDRGVFQRLEIFDPLRDRKALFGASGSHLPSCLEVGGQRFFDGFLELMQHV